METRKESAEDKKLVSNVLNVFSRLKEERRRHESLWEEITDYLYPCRAGWNFETDTDSFGELIFDGTGIASHNKLADGIFGWLCAPSIDWLDLQPIDSKDRDNKALMQHLDLCKQHLYRVFDKSNFYDAISEDIHDCSALGTSVMVMEDEGEYPTYIPLHLREVYISENRFGKVDTLYRDFEMTMRQVVDQFPDAVDDNFKKSAASNGESKVRVLHAQWPRDVNIDSEEIDKPRIKSEKEYASVYILQGTASASGAVSGGILLENGGVDEKQFEAWRFSKSPGEVYGRSPGMDAIFDIKMINLMAKTMADVAQLAARPPISAPEAMRGKLHIKPEGISYRVSEEEIKPIITTLAYPYGKEEMQQKIAVIREHFRTDYFMVMSQIQAGSRQRTATEVMELKAEGAAALGPIIGRVQEERLDPMVRMTIANEVKKGRMPKAPDGIDPNIAIKVVYCGPLAQAQRKYLMVQGINQGLSATLQYAQVDPFIVYNFNLNEAGRELAVSSGLPYKFLRAKNEAEALQGQARQAQAQAAEREQARLDAQANASKAVAPEPGSPLSREMSQNARGE